MVALRKINGNYYAYFYDSSRGPKRKSYPLRVSLKSAAEKLKHPTTRFKFFVRKATVRCFRPRSVAGRTGGKAALGDAFVFVRNRQDVQTYQNPLQNAVCGE